MSHLSRIPRPVRIAAAVVAAVLLLVTVGVVVILRGPSLRRTQFVSVSTAPEGGPAAPVFSYCDSIRCACACDDPFDPRVMPDEGAFAGMCLNTCRTRSARLLPAESASAMGYFPDAAAGDGCLYVYNVYHLPDTADTPSFHVARVPVDAVSEAIFQVEHAGGLQGHAQMRFHLKADRPAILVPQRTSVDRAETAVGDLYYSVEALMPPGVPYKGDYGFRREFFQRYRMATQLVRAKTMIRRLRRRVWQYRLDVSESQLAQLLLVALEQATNADPDERYHTSQNNCALRIYSVIDRVVPPAWYRRLLLWLTDNTLFMPTRMPEHLRYRGLSSERLRLPNLEVELGWEHLLPAADASPDQ